MMNEKEYMQKVVKELTEINKSLKYFVDKAKKNEEFRFMESE